VLVELGAFVLVVVSQDTPSILFKLVLLYSVYGYNYFLWRKANGEPVSMFADDEKKEL
jgi:hypothetical protein